MKTDPAQARSFSCTACGKCCDRGPEMELGESLQLADTFLLSLLFKVHSLPRNERTETARRWWRGTGSRLGPGPALNEHRRHIEIFSAVRQVDRSRDRQLFLTLSAIVEDEHDGKCPALLDNSCSIYDRRPLTCRTVPLHYSRPPSTLASYLDGFVGTPGYQCATSGAPEILKGPEVLSPEIRTCREDAVEVANRDRVWKTVLVESMKQPDVAAAAGLPTLDAVIANSDRGYASMVPFIVAWRAAVRADLMTPEMFSDLCRKQIALAETTMVTKPERHAAMRERLDLYRSEPGSGVATDPRPSSLWPGP